MDDAAPAPAVQQQHDSASASGAPAAAPPTWGTLEELLLVGAITRHGAGDWAIIAAELQSRAKLLTMPAAYFSPEACKSRFDALNGKYGHSFRGAAAAAAAADGRDKEPENHWPWFEDIRKRRVAQLRRELERHDGSISILTQKLKRLKTERGPKQLLETTCKPPLQPAEETTTSSEKAAVVEVPPSSAGEAPVVVEQSRGGSAAVDAPAAAADAGGALQSMEDKYVPAADEAASNGDEEQQPGPAVEEAGISQEEVAAGTKMEVSKSDLSGEAAKDEPQPEAAQVTGGMEVDDGAGLSTPAQAIQPTEAGGETEDEMKVADGPSEDQETPANDPLVKETDSSSCSLKMLAEDDRLVVAISAEASDGQAITKTEANTAGSPEDRSEKEASSNGSSQEASKPIEEKSDESQVAAARGDENSEPPEKAVDVGSPLSAEGPQEQSKDGASQVDKSEVGSQVEGLGEDASPTSKNLKKGDPKLVDWLKTLYNHKFGPMFKQKQESQDDSRYDQLIKRHMDLNMIRSRLEAGGYSSSMEFFRDLLLLFSNATVFYPRDSEEHNAAALLRKLTMEEMDRVLRAEDAGPTTKPTTTRKRPTTTNKATAVPAAAAAAALAPATAPAVATTSRTTTQGGDVSVSENSKSKSASVSLGVRSSKGGDEGEGGEPEVSGKSKPLKAYVRKNRAERGKAVKESPLETIVQKEAAMVAAKDSKAAVASKGKNAAREKEKLTKEKSEKSGARGSKGAAASAAASAPPAAASAAAPAIAPVRGARNKRSKEPSQRGGGNAGKRSRRT